MNLTQWICLGGTCSVLVLAGCQSPRYDVPVTQSTQTEQWARLRSLQDLLKEMDGAQPIQWASMLSKAGESSPIIDQKLQELGIIDEKLTKLRYRFRDGHPEVAPWVAQQKELENQLLELSLTRRQTLEVERDDLEARLRLATPAPKN